MKILNLFLVSLFISTAVLAENSISFRIGFGYSTYNLENIKDYQTSVSNYYLGRGIPIEIYDKFPDNYSGQIQFALNVLDRINVGFFFDYGETGGRMHYRDYSGEVESIQKLIKKAPGIFGEYLLKKYENLSIYFSLQLSLTQTTFKYESKFLISNYFTPVNETLKNTSYGITPLIIAEYRINLFLIRANIGYESNTIGEFEKSYEYHDQIMFRGYLRETDWSGLRAFITLGFILPD